MSMLCRCALAAALLSVMLAEPSASAAPAMAPGELVRRLAFPATQPVEFQCVFRRTSEVDHEAPPGELRMWSDNIFYGFVANDGSFNLTCPDVGMPQPTWNGTKLIKKSADEVNYVSDTKNVMVFRTQPLAAFLGEHIRSQGIINHALEYSEQIVEWARGLEIYDPKLPIEAAAQQPNGAVALSQRIDARGVLVNYLIAAVSDSGIPWRIEIRDSDSGALIGSTDASDPVEVAPGVWRPKSLTSTLYKCTMERGRFVAVLRDGKPVLTSRRRVEILDAKLRERLPTDFVTSAPAEARQTYRALPSGEYVQLTGPGFGTGGADRLMKALANNTVAAKKDQPRPTSALPAVANSVGGGDKRSNTSTLIVGIAVGAALVGTAVAVAMIARQRNRSSASAGKGVE